MGIRYSHQGLIWEQPEDENHQNLLWKRDLSLLIYRTYCNKPFRALYPQGKTGPYY